MFMQRVSKVRDIPRGRKLNKLYTEAYLKFVEDLGAYLQDFYRRTNPLAPHGDMLQLIRDDFEQRWTSKDSSLNAWFAPSVQNGERKDTAVANDDVESALYCKACDKLFAKQSVFDGHLKGKAHQKAEEKYSATAAERDAKQWQLSKQIAWAEEIVVQYSQLMSDVFHDTVAHLEKKQTRSWDELKREMDESETLGSTLDDDSDDESKPIYNPLNLPMGPDGKPIPYWLYKLHGLNIPYTCEICGGYTYLGPRNFERHFKDWRHSYGMRCLGIPNTDEFMLITKQDDALQLWEKLKKQKAVGEFRFEEEEEYEDKDGNVYNKKTFEDLKRQGII